MRQQLVAVIALVIAVVYPWRRIRPTGFSLAVVTSNVIHPLRARTLAGVLVGSSSTLHVSYYYLLAKMWSVCIRYRRSLQLLVVLMNTTVRIHFL